MEQNPAVLSSPRDVANELEISTSTLRRWSDEFADYLSIGAGTAKGRSHRRYTDNDVGMLSKIKMLMDSGLTYEQVRHQINGNKPESGNNEAEFVDQPDDDHFYPESPEDTDQPANEDLDNLDDDDDHSHSLVASQNDGSPAVAFMTNTLAALSDSQKSILNSQAANRELLGVLLQDNFNLKEENSRLRERILEVERDIAQNRQEEEWRREALRQELETKISTVSQLATEAIGLARTVETPEIKAIDNKPGCLGMLLGRGGTKIITAPKRRKAEGQAHSLQPSGGGNQTQYPGTSSQQQSAQAKHPKPLHPPE